MCDDPRHHHDHDAVPADHAGTRVVVAGKGGVGKTTLSALLARHLAAAGRPVLAVDGDEQANLGPALGFDDDALAAVVPLAGATAYVTEKTGAAPGQGSGAMLRLNPDVADAAERLAVTGPDGVRLLVMGGVARPGGGCLCPETAVLAAVLASMAGHHDEVVLLDTHAGVEHFGRALARGFDQALVVTDATRNAVSVALRTAELAAGLGIGRLHLVVNRVRSPADVDWVVDQVAAAPVVFAAVHALPLAAGGPEADVAGLRADDALGPAVAGLAEALTAVVVSGEGR